MTKRQKDLEQIIRANPGCFALVDNDGWTLHREDPDNNPHKDGFMDDWNQWDVDNELASNSDIKSLGDGGYGSGNCYGGDLLQALAAIVGIKVTSV